jgi:hypothetical protein
MASRTAFCTALIEREILVFQCSIPNKTPSCGKREPKPNEEPWFGLAFCYRYWEVCSNGRRQDVISALRPQRSLVQGRFRHLDLCVLSPQEAQVKTLAAGSAKWLPSLLSWPVEVVLYLVSAGIGLDEILVDHPELEREDILACLHYARLLVSGETLPRVV